METKFLIKYADNNMPDGIILADNVYFDGPSEDYKFEMKTEEGKFVEVGRANKKYIASIIRTDRLT